MHHPPAAKGSSALSALFARHPVVAVGLLTGLSSAWPMPLVTSTLQAWWTSHGGSLLSSGWITCFGLPYALKWVWAPWLDRSRMLWLDHRRGWALCTQLWVACSCLLVAWLQTLPNQHAILPFQLLTFAGIALAGATQDVVLDAYRIEVASQSDYPILAAWTGTFYRVGWLFTAGLALWVADLLGWSWMFVAAGVTMLCWAYCTACLPGVRASSTTDRSMGWLAVWRGYLPQQSPMLWLMWLLTYRLGDRLVSSLGTVFLLKGCHLSLAMTGTVYKVVGLGATLLGGWVSAWAMRACNRTVWVYGVAVLQTLSVLGYGLLAQFHHGTALAPIVSVVAFESLTAGITGSVLVVLLMERCQLHRLGQQYAFATALSLLPGFLVGPFASAWVNHFGWAHWFYGATCLSCVAWCCVPRHVLNPPEMDERR